MALIRQVGMSGKDVGGMTLSWSTITQLNYEDFVVYIILHINGTKKCALREPPVAQTIHELQTPSDYFGKNARSSLLTRKPRTQASHADNPIKKRMRKWDGKKNGSNDHSNASH